MAQIINTNIASLNAQRNLNSAQSGNDTALQRLSSGLRINSAADDAAGLSISTRFDAQINGSNQAIRNSADGVSLAQTAEGALDSITDSLQRIRELAVQSANGTNNAVDREALNLEAQQLIDEIENVSQTANFNGTSLLDGSFSGITFQTGANVGNSIDVSIGEVSTSTLGAADSAGVTAFGGLYDNANDAIVTGEESSNKLANGDLVINGVAIEASKAGSDTASSTLNANSAIAKAAAINEKSAETGVTATVLENTLLGASSFSGGSFDTISGNIDVNGVTVNIETSGNLDNNTNREAVAAAINAVSGQTGVTAINTGNDNTGVTLVAADGRNITIDVGNLSGTDSAADIGLGSGAVRGGASSITQTGSFLLQSKDGSDINIGAGTGTLENAGLTAGDKSGVRASLSSDRSSFADGDTAALPTTGTIEAGDLTVNGITIRETRASDDTLSYSDGGTTVGDEYTARSAVAKAAAINEVSETTGVTAVVESNVVNSATQTAGASIAIATGSVQFNINGVKTSTIDLSSGDDDVRRSNAVDAINNVSGQTGVIAVDTGDGIELRAEDGRNISVEQEAAGMFASVGMQDGTGANAVDQASVYVGTVRLEAAGEFELGSNTGEISDLGFKAGTFGAAESGTFLKDVDITTVDGALEAITAVDNALQQVSNERANLGATQNRFNSTINNLTISSENLSASNSRIRDADYAAETAELSRTQVLIQAGISVLAQANARPQQVLSLLG